MSLTCRQCGLLPSHPLMVTVPIRCISFRLFRRKRKVKPEEDILLQGVPADVDAPPGYVKKTGSMWDDLSEEQIDKIRNKSNLPHDVVCELKGIPEFGNRLRELKHYRRDFVRQYFAMYGKASGLKPGVCWPSKQELEFRIKWEETFYPKLDDMLKRKRSEREQADKELAKYRSDILQKLKLLPQAKKDFYEKIREKKLLEDEEKAKREKVIQDVREYLGYDVAPGDTRFQEALVKREEEEKLAKKVQRKESRSSSFLSQLTAMVQEQEKSARDAAKDADKDDAKPDGDSDSKSKKSTPDQ